MTEFLQVERINVWSYAKSIRSYIAFFLFSVYEMSNSSGANRALQQRMVAVPQLSCS